MDFKHFQTLVDNLFSYDDAGLVTRYQDVKPETLNPLVLAYIGDAYFNLYMRSRLLAFEQNKVQILHSFGAKMVSAKYQAVAYKEIEAELTELEQAVLKEVAMRSVMYQKVQPFRNIVVVRGLKRCLDFYI